MTSSSSSSSSSFLWYWGLNSGPSPWATPPVLFLWRVFRDRVSQTICLGWLWTVLILISPSRVARIGPPVPGCPPAFWFLHPCTFLLTCTTTR
jgi:hypothetical protein